jgi:hypothetical protein
MSSLIHKYQFIPQSQIGTMCKNVHKSVQVQWVKNAKKDYSIGIYSANKIIIQECV